MVALTLTGKDDKCTTLVSRVEFYKNRVASKLFFFYFPKIIFPENACERCRRGPARLVGVLRQKPTVRAAPLAYKKTLTGRQELKFIRARVDRPARPEPTTPGRPGSYGLPDPFGVAAVRFDDEIKLHSVATA